MRIVGLEPTRLAAADFESTVSAIPPYPHIINYYIIVLIFCQVIKIKNISQKYFQYLLTNFKLYDIMSIK